MEEELVGFFEKTGKPHYYRWLRCPDWTKGKTMFIEGAFITYTALELKQDFSGFIPMFGYTRYQTCDERIIY